MWIKQELIGMILDNPIRTKRDDLLNRSSLAVHIAEGIRRLAFYSSSESFVIGIEGDWGSGKTSLINLVLEHLKSSDVLIIKFNPWNFSDQNELITDFFDSIADVLKQTEREKGEEIAEKIKNYSFKLLKRSELAIAPEVSFLGIKLKLGTIYKTDRNNTLEKQKETINSLLKEVNKRIVVVIDDIDRLDTQETRLIFKLVKMTANFANTVFLLAYDRVRVGEMISEEKIPGEEFLKKIVQLSFPLPRVDQRELFGILFGEIDKIVADLENDLWDQRRWEDMFESGLKKLFPTVRDIKRYINSLRLDLEIVGKEEVNPVDFLGIEAIRVFVPDVYFAMAKEKQTFAFPAADNIYDREDPFPFPGMKGWFDEIAQDPSGRKTICEKIIEKGSPEELSEAITEIIKKLFPQVETLYSQNPRDEWEQELDQWTQQLRVCSESVFDKYFSLSIVSSVLSEEDLRDFLAKIEDRSASAEKLKKFQEENKLDILLRRLLGSLHSLALSIQQLEGLLTVLFDFKERVTPAGFFGSGSLDYRVQGLAYKISETIPKEKRVESLARILNSTKDIARSTQFVDLMTENAIEYKKANEYERAKNFPEGLLLTEEEVGGLDEICIEKIKKAAEDGSLENETMLGHILSCWKKWGSEEQAKKHATELIKTDDGLLRFLKAHVREDGIRIQESKESMGKFVNLTDLDNRVAQLELSKLNERDARVIKAYRV